jgi:hypothetical protein
MIEPVWLYLATQIVARTNKSRQKEFLAGNTFIRLYALLAAKTGVLCDLTAFSSPVFCSRSGG